MKNATLEAALRYATREKWLVFPVRFIGKKKVGWTSAEKSNGNNWGYTRDEKEIREYWRRWPTAAIGLPTGAVNGIFVLDLDTEEGGHAANGEVSLAALMQGTPRRLPLTRGAITPTGGLHIYYKQPSGIAVPCSTSKLGPGIDVRGDGGYVVAPPSMRPRVGPYEWQTTIGTATVKSAPGWLLDLVSADRRPGPRVIDLSKYDPVALAAMSADVGRGISLRPEDHVSFAPMTMADLEVEIRFALTVIPSDDYHLWIKIGAAIHSGLGDAGLALFDQWSRECPAKYDAPGTERKWRDLQNMRQVSVNSIFYIATEHDPTWRDDWRAYLRGEVQA
jgi:hypothetical protein